MRKFSSGCPSYCACGRFRVWIAALTGRLATSNIRGQRANATASGASDPVERCWAPSTGYRLLDSAHGRTKMVRLDVRTWDPTLADILNQTSWSPDKSCDERGC